MWTKLLLALLTLAGFVCSVTVTVLPPPPLNLNALINLQLAKHNYYRSLHGVPALTLNTTLVNIAQNHSQYIYSIHEMQHSTGAKNGQYGQNIYWHWGSPTVRYTGGDASIDWYDENVNYDYATGTSKNGKTIGHFTAMIWKSVTSVGFGFTQGPENITYGTGTGIYVVANYYPTPNVAGQYIANVLP